MLTYASFTRLEETLQAQFLWLDGVLLLTRKTHHLGVELYSLYHFYVEVFFDQHSGDPLYIKAFDDMEKLDVYLDQIPIQPVLA